MLQHLSIENYTLIQKLSINFDDGFSVITGETGAGKSILLGALALLSGQRADTSVLFDKTRKSIVEAVFHIQNYGLEDFFAENDIDYDKQCIIRREITPQEKSRAFINDTPVPLTVLKKMGEMLMDIHVQNTNLLLQNKEFQLVLVDQYAKIQKEIVEYKQQYKKYLNLQKEYQSLFENNINQDKDYWEFLFNELNEAHLQAGEQQSLEDELRVLSNSEEIKQQLFAVYQLLQEGENNILSQLFDCRNRIQTIGNYKQEISDLAERLQSQIVDLKDIVYEVNNLQEKTLHDPQRIEFITQRLNDLYSLQQKHKVNSEQQLIEIQAQIDKRLQNIVQSELHKTYLLNSIAEFKDSLVEMATKISEKRKAVIGNMERDLKKVLQLMNMPNASIQIKMEQSSLLNDRGLDKVLILFSANPGMELQAVEKIASGGELSRLMLAMKSLISQKNVLPTIIFDEIDSGVSGEVSAKMANVMQGIAAYSQVIAITHVPQIAAKGNHHYLVYKQTDNQKTVSDIHLLTSEERVVEIAKMISNEKVTETSLNAAKNLLLG